ncbi:MAG: GNAT family N-acetyltransferase [Defluviitaleaceae bacterium]|nr:GNAT family N-acetyltransferase [Defluviitaleaceae bacterium]
MINLRLATPDDIDTVEAIMDDACKYLGSQGLPQWQNGYGPNRASLDNDVRLGHGYVLEADGAVRGYASLEPGPEDDYEALQNGSWEGPGEKYAVIHRVMVDQAVRGRRIGITILKMLVDEAHRMGFNDIRIDTYPGNTIMKKTVSQAGFTQRGEIMLNIPDGERIAYQILL